VTVNEGQTAANTGGWGDVAPDTGALTASVGTITENTDGTWSWSYGTDGATAASQTVTITATDNDGMASTATFTLVVNDLAPTLTVANSTVTVNEGQTAANTGSWGDVA